VRPTTVLQDEEKCIFMKRGVLAGRRKMYFNKRVVLAGRRQMYFTKSAPNGCIARSRKMYLKERISDWNRCSADNVLHTRHKHGSWTVTCNSHRMQEVGFIYTANA
jgi:hypothetical protein